jgi:hypothetical protein
LQGPVLLRDQKTLALLIDKGAEQFFDSQGILADLLSDCLQSLDVTEFDHSTATFTDGWMEGLQLLITSGANVSSESAQRALLIAKGLRFNHPVRLLLSNSIHVPPAEIINQVFLECLEEKYENLPRGRKSFIAKILEMTSEVGVDALRFGQDRLLCAAW